MVSDILSPPLLCGDVEDVVSPDESVSILLLELSLDIFLSLLQGNIHVAIQADQDPTIIHAGVQLDNHGTVQQGLQEIIGVLTGTHLKQKERFATLIRIYKIII